MEYTINKLAQMSGISTRTLRYYDQIGLLCPKRMSTNGYRIYGQNEVDLLQQILFYRELGVPLEEIGQILNAPDYDREKALSEHLLALLQRKNQIELLIKNVTKTISTLKGEAIMNNNEKFEGFKQKLLEDNEKNYGEELRSKYDNESLKGSFQKVKGMSKEQWENAQKLSAQINELLKVAVAENNPSSEIAQKVCDMHRQWLCMFWKEGTYSKEAHKALAEGYVEDERFTAYYDKIAVGCTKFLRDAIVNYCS